MIVRTADELRELGREMYLRAGATAEEAEVVVDQLVDSNVAGHDSHGVVRLVQYLDAVESG